MKLRALFPCILLAAASPTLFAALPGADLLAGVIMGDLDRDYDGKLDANEWTDGTDDGFEEIDQNLDGIAEPKEIEHLAEPLSNDLGKVGATICVALIEKLFMTLDKNKDGKVSKAEYREGCAAIFKKLDANGDGVVTKAELMDLPTKLLTKG